MKLSTFKLKDDYGYVPRPGEKSVIFNGSLIVIHPDHRPRVYDPGCNGQFYELRPLPRSE